jgi:hypothetical protein
MSAFDPFQTLAAFYPRAAGLVRIGSSDLSSKNDTSEIGGSGNDFGIRVLT